MRYLLLALSLLLAGPAAAQSPPLKLPPGVLAWSASRPLMLADFRGRPAPGQPHAALTSSNINSGISCQGNVFTGTARASFDPATSWVRDPAHLTPALLRHEQLHFDIAEVHARRLRQQLRTLRLPCSDALGPAFRKLSEAGYAAWQEAEDTYDRETNHGLLAAPQAAWEARVRQQLAELDAFAEPEGS